MYSRFNSVFSPLLAMALFCCLASLDAAAGPYAPAAGRSGTTAVAKTSTAIKGWATGYSNYRPGSSVDTTFRTPAKALGPAVGDAFDIVSLGNAGSITLSFSGTLYDGPGWDFAVFENSFSNSFLELAFVEVSSDGSRFFRFPSFSFTPAPVGAFGAVDPTNIDGLAGKYRQGFGTPFDLGIFASVPGLDVNRISHIRLVDVVGDGRERDALGNRIYDPFPTSGSVGFDLDAVGLRYLRTAAVTPVIPPVTQPGSAGPTPVPAPAAAGLLAAALGLVALRRRPLRVTTIA